MVDVGKTIGWHHICTFLFPVPFFKKTGLLDCFRFTSETPKTSRLSVKCPDVTPTSRISSEVGIKQNKKSTPGLQ